MDLFNRVPTFSDVGPIVLLPAILCGIYFLFSFGSRGLDLPPGPPTKPFIGNLDVFPTGHIHLEFARWGELLFPHQFRLVASNLPFEQLRSTATCSRSNS